MTLRFLSFILVGMLGACASTENTQVKSQPEHDVYMDAGNLFFNGSITAEKTKVALTLFDEHKPQAFYISSPGGDVESAIELAYKVRAEKVAVHIGKVCASSCANYILPAAEKAFLGKDSILVWHGSSYQDDLSKRMRENGENSDFIASWRKLESDFYSAVGVSPLITVCGVDQVSLSDKFSHLFQIKKIAGFTYSLEDIKKFGVNNIYLKDDVWQGTPSNSRMNIIKANYCDSVSWQI